MKRLYEKKELLFSLLWICIYVVLFSLADNASKAMGTEKLLTAPLAVGLSVFLFLWIRRHGLNKTYGLCRADGAAKRSLWYLPLVLLVTVNLWGGVQRNLSAAESLLYVITMFGVGFLEELLFRGFLFRTLEKDNRKSAVAISSITFGIGHIVNLLNGAEFVPTLLQILYAIAIGYLFTVLFYRTGTLLPCIVTHGVFNALSAFAAERTAGMEIAAIVTLVALPLIYAQWLNRGAWQTEQKPNAD